jgi:sterol 24-C-methyltransferase
MTEITTQTTKIQTPGITNIFSGFGSGRVEKEFKEYYSLFQNDTEASTTEFNKRQKEYKLMTTNFYDLVTDFYEYGWGESFHFAPRHAKETFDQSIARSEQYVGLRLGLKPGMKVLDIGCGVGGPMREIARFSGASITGINISEYQIVRGNQHNIRAGLESICSFLKADFCNLPLPDNSSDAAYAIEATCHAPKKELVFGEVFRVLKPGSYFCVYDWVMTELYDSKNPEHVRIRKGIEVGNALPDIPHYNVVLEAFKSVGFEIVEVTDFGKPSKINPVPWYDTLDGKLSLTGFRFTRLGRWCTDKMVSILESAKIAPKGSTDTSRMLNDTANALVEGGKTGIFSPSFFVLGRKPEAK